MELPPNAVPLNRAKRRALEKRLKASGADRQRAEASMPCPICHNNGYIPPEIQLRLQMFWRGPPVNVTCPLCNADGKKDERMAEYGQTA